MGSGADAASYAVVAGSCPERPHLPRWQWVPGLPCNLCHVDTTILVSNHVYATREEERENGFVSTVLHCQETALT